MVASNPFDAYVEQILARTKRGEIAIRVVITRLTDMIASAQKVRDAADGKLGSLQCQLNAARAALEIVQREQQ